MGKYIYQAIITPEDEGGFSVEVPDLPGCFTYGDTYEDAAYMAADAAKTYVASLLKHGDSIPEPTMRNESGIPFMIFFETDEDYIVSGETVSAAEASRMLGVSAGRVTHMLSAGLLDGYRNGRRTFVTVDSIKKRMASNPGSGRPKRQALIA